MNSDGVIDSQDITYLGNTTPRYAFGFNFNATYKNWDLGVVLQGVGKRDFYLNGQIMNNFRDSWANFGYTLHLDYWSEDNEMLPCLVLIWHHKAITTRNIRPSGFRMQLIAV